jgi:hypothetical protein
MGIALFVRSLHMKNSRRPDGANGQQVFVGKWTANEATGSAPKITTFAVLVKEKASEAAACNQADCKVRVLFDLDALESASRRGIMRQPSGHLPTHGQSCLRNLRVMDQTVCRNQRDQGQVSFVSRMISETANGIRIQPHSWRWTHHSEPAVMHAK